MSIEAGAIQLLFVLLSQTAVAQERQILHTFTMLGCELASASFSIQRSNGRPPDFDVVLYIDGKTVTCPAPEHSKERAGPVCLDSFLPRLSDLSALLLLV